MTNPGILFYGLMFWFLVFMGAAYLINRLLKRQVVNGALFFAVVTVTLFVVAQYGAMRADMDPVKQGELIGAFLLPAGVAIYFARQFQRKKRAANQSEASKAPEKEEEMPMERRLYE